MLAILLLASLAQAPAVGPALRVGDPAPPFVVERFLRGEPRAELARGRVQVIEFWTAWCGPCIAGMPHLEALQRELGPHGLDVIGVAPRPDAWGHDLAAIQALLERKASDTYALALDAESDSKEGYLGVFRGRTIESWMGAAEVRAVPIAFVVDREGRLAAITPPLEIDATVRACLDGTFDRARAAADYRALLAARAQAGELASLLKQGERTTALALSEELLAGALWNDGRGLGGVADRWLGVEPVAEELALALRAARRANELSGERDAGGLGLEARLLLRAGERARAERVESRALALSEGALREAIDHDFAARLPVPSPALVAAADGVLSAFEHAPLVGLCEHHRRAEGHDFLLALVDRPHFGQVVDDVVVEFGNARYQPLIDRWLAGEEVPPAELARVWRDTTQWLVWDSPLYERFFGHVRARNLERPPEERVRILLGDPPIAWEDVHGASDYAASADRDGHFAALVEREVLARGRKALLVAGSVHLQRRGPLEGRLPGGPSLAGLLEERHPEQLFVVWTLGAGDEARALGLGDAPSLHYTDADPLGTKSFALLAPRKVQIRVDGEWRPLGELAWPPVRELADALLDLGRTDTQVEPDRALYEDAAVQTELRRRATILHESLGLDFLPELEELLAAPNAR